MIRVILTAGLALALADVAAADIDELVVTARKRAEPLLETPVAVSAFDAAQIRRLDLTSLGDISRYTPGFSLDSATGRQATSYRPVIRGQTTIRNGIANTSAVTTFIDGVYIGGSVQPTELYNLERVEILRGPQAAQYGRGTYAGAINYVTRAPAKEREGEVTLSVAEHGTRVLNTWLSGPAGAQAGFFIGAGYREYGGEYRNQLDGSRVGQEQQTDLSGKVTWEPGANVHIAARLGWQHTNDGHFAASLQSSELNNCCPRTAAAPRARGYYIGVAPSAPPVNLATDLLDAAGGDGTEQERLLASVVLDQDFTTGMTLTSTTGYVTDHVTRGYDLSYANYDPLSFSPGAFTTFEKIRQTDLSQELRLNSPETDRLRWTAGIYGYRGELGDRFARRVYRDTAGNIVVAPATGPLVTERIRNMALFGSLENDLSRHWTVGVELRWARDEVELVNRANDGTGMVTDRFADSWYSLTPRFTASYATDYRTTVYASVAHGTKPGDFNPEVDDPALRTVREESVWTYELGMKGTAADNFSYTLAVYHSDIDDQQLTTLVELDDGRTVSLLTNAGRSRVNGVELEASAAVHERLTLRLAYAWTNAEFRDYISNEQADLLGSDGSLAANNALGSVAGKRLPRVPEHTVSIVADYRHLLAKGREAYVIADWSFESSRFAQEHNFIETGDRSLVGLRAGFRTEHWDVNLWARNLLDDDTPNDITRYFDRRGDSLPTFPQQGPRPSSSPRGFIISLPRGRQAGATLRYSF